MSTKPPLGIMPLNIWIENRILALALAIETQRGICHSSDMSWGERKNALLEIKQYAAEINYLGKLTP